jgi:hypothetical protein
MRRKQVTARMDRNDSRRAVVCVSAVLWFFSWSPGICRFLFRRSFVIDL